MGVGAYTYCATSKSVSEAVAILKRSPLLIVDTEGKEIGTQGGCLSIISVGTYNTRHIFLFDVVALSQPQQAVTSNRGGNIQPLLDLFQDSTYTKLMWDGRQDYIEIIDTYGCEMTHILDLQIVELVSRWQVRGEEEKHRRQRLQRGFFGFADVRNHPDRYEGLHIVAGMQKCVEENGLGLGKDPTVKELYKKFGSEIWMERPVRDILLDYAATDIKLIAKLYTHFRQTGCISRKTTPGLVNKSQNYVKSQAQAGRRIKSDIFTRHPLVLEAVLDDTPNNAVQCAKCLLLLPEYSFDTRVRKKHNRMRRSHCTKCVAIALKKVVKRAS